MIKLVIVPSLNNRESLLLFNDRFKDRMSRHLLSVSLQEGQRCQGCWLWWKQVKRRKVHPEGVSKWMDVEKKKRKKNKCGKTLPSSNLHFYLHRCFFPSRPHFISSYAGVSYKNSKSERKWEREKGPRFRIGRILFQSAHISANEFYENTFGPFN